MTARDGVLAVGFDFGGTLAPRLSPLLHRFWRDEFSRCLSADAAQVALDDFERSQAAYYEEPGRDPDASIRLAAQAVRHALRCAPDASYPIGARIDAAVRARFAAEIPAQAGAVELLGWLSGQRLRIGVLSNFIFPTSTVKAWLTAQGLAEHVRTVVSSSDTSAAKPSRDAFLYLLTALGLRRSSQLVYVGNDWAEDIEGALAAGCHAIYMAGTDPGGEPVRGRIKVPEVRSLLEIPDVIEAMR